jgi:hypothetical protein
MSLSCGCDGSLDDYSWMHYGPSDFKELGEHGTYKRRKRCASCGALIGLDEECVRFDRVRAARSEYEANRFGDEVSLPPVFQCEKCAQFFIPLWELGFHCMSPDTPVREYLEDYWGLTGFVPKTEDNTGRS